MNYGIRITESLFNPKINQGCTLKNVFIYCKGFESLEALDEYLLQFTPVKQWGFDYMPAERESSERKIVYISTSKVRKCGVGCDGKQILDQTYRMCLFEDIHLDDLWSHTIQKGYGVETYVLER